MGSLPLRRGRGGAGGLNWVVERVRGSASDLHARAIPAATRAVWIFEVEHPALVLGSRQPLVAVDGLEVVRRQSGGGAVWVEPSTTLWIDVVVPRDDPLWDDDVGRATHWLGDVWAGAIGDPAAVVHRGAMVRTDLSDAVCFAGLGPGEVTVGGRKAVGISQRRVRAAARFQCVAYEKWDPAPLARALALDPAPLAAVGVGVGRVDRVEAALLTALRAL